MAANLLGHLLVTKILRVIALLYLVEVMRPTLDRQQLLKLMGPLHIFLFLL